MRGKECRRDQGQLAGCGALLAERADKAVMSGGPTQFGELGFREVEQPCSFAQGLIVKRSARALLDGAQNSRIDAQLHCHGLLQQATPRSDVAEGAGEVERAGHGAVFSLLNLANMWTVESYWLPFFYAPMPERARFVSPCCISQCCKALQPREIAQLLNVEFWPDFFRVTFMNKIDYLRTLVWLHQLKQVTGCLTIKALAARVDPGSVWTDAEGDEHQSKWYQYAQGVQVPSPALVARIQVEFPKVTFELHHPVWRVLRKPCSARSWTRLRTVMAEKWGELPAQLRSCSTDELKHSPTIGNALALKGLGYLDALALFASERRLRLVRRDFARVKQLALVLAVLPVLYADDCLWDDMEASILEVALTTLDGALGLSHGIGEEPACRRRADQILARRERLASYVARYPHALSTEVALRRFLAARWDPCDRSHIRPLRRRRAQEDSYSP